MSLAFRCNTYCMKSLEGFVWLIEYAVGGCDKQVHMWSLATNQTQVVAKHDAPIPYCFHVKEMNNMLVTGSWDKTIKYWDLRSQNPVHTQQLPERVYGMDISYPLMVVGMAGRRVQVSPLALAFCKDLSYHQFSRPIDNFLNIAAFCADFFNDESFVSNETAVEWKYHCFSNTFE